MSTAQVPASQLRRQQEQADAWRGSLCFPKIDAWLAGAGEEGPASIDDAQAETLVLGAAPVELGAGGAAAGQTLYLSDDSEGGEEPIPRARRGGSAEPGDSAARRGAVRLGYGAEGGGG